MKGLIILNIAIMGGLVGTAVVTNNKVNQPVERVSHYKSQPMFLKALADGWTVDNENKLLIPSGEYKPSQVSGSKLTYTIEPGTSFTVDKTEHSWVVARLYEGRLSIFSGTYQDVK